MLGGPCPLGLPAFALRCAQTCSLVLAVLTPHSVDSGHVFDLCRLFCGGDALWCSASISEGGHPATIADKKFSSGDHVGPLVSRAQEKPSGTRRPELG